MNLHINDFEGPLDLLLHLVKSSKMDIYEIDTCQVIEEYLAFINTLDKNDLDDASEYLVMAAELIHLKSRLLINIETEETKDDDEEFSINSEEDLKNKLIAYEKYKELSNQFRELEKNRQDYFTKIPENISEFRGDTKLTNDGSVTLDDLVKAFMELQKREEYHKPVQTRITKKEMSVEDKTIYLRKILSKKKKTDFASLFTSFDKENVIVTFLALLIMSKNDEIILTQKENFGNIFIERKCNNE
jgi:segregation and condensation protein A